MKTVSAASRSPFRWLPWLSLVIIGAFWLLIGAIDFKLALFVAALWVLLGLCALDVMLQLASDWSPFGALDAKGLEFSRANKEGRIFSNVMRGTTATWRDIEADLFVGLNNAVPFRALGVHPLRPARLERAVYDPRHWKLLGAWFAMPVLATLWLATTQQAAAPSYQIPAAAVGMFSLLCAALIPAATEKVGDPHKARTGLSFLMKIGCVVAAIAVLFALFSTIRTSWFDGIDSFSERTGTVREQLAEPTLWLIGIIVVASLLAKSLIWLGCYTNDLRVNLLEPAAHRLWWAGLFLAAAAVITAWEHPPLLRAAILLLLAAVIARLIPFPPRLSNQTGRGEYVLSAKDGLIEYGNWETSVRSAARLTSIPLSEAEAENAEKIAAARLEAGPDYSLGALFYNFNSANTYVHLLTRPAAQLILFLATLAGIAFVALAPAYLAGLLCHGLSLLAGAATLPRGTASGIVALSVALIGLALGAFAMVRTAARCHRIVGVLPYARGEVADAAIRCVQIYGNDPNPQAPRWEAMVELSGHFDRLCGRLLVQEASAFTLIGQFGGLDDLAVERTGSWSSRLACLGLAHQARLELLGLFSSFPDAVRDHLLAAHIPPPLIAEAVRSWTKDLANPAAFSVIRLNRIDEERKAAAWLASIRQHWSVIHAGQVPHFEAIEHLQQYVARLSSIVKLKQREIAAVVANRAHPAWRPFEEPISVQGAATVTARQSDLMALLSSGGKFELDPDDAGIRFTDSSRTERFEQLQSELSAAVLAIEHANLGDWTRSIAAAADLPAPSAREPHAPFLELRERFIRAAFAGDVDSLLKLLGKKLLAPEKRETTRRYLNTGLLPFFKGPVRVHQNFSHLTVPNDDQGPCEMAIGAILKNDIIYRFKLTFAEEHGKLVIVDAAIRK